MKGTKPKSKGTTRKSTLFREQIRNATHSLELEYEEFLTLKKQAIERSIQAAPLLERLSEEKEDPAEAFRLLREYLAKLEGRNIYPEPSHSEAVREASNFFFGWVIRWARSSLDMKGEADFFIGVLKAVKKAWPTDAESQVMRIKVLLREETWESIYRSEIAGYTEMSRDQQIEAEQSFRLKFRVGKSRLKKSRNPKAPKG